MSRGGSPSHRHRRLRDAARSDALTGLDGPDRLRAALDAVHAMHGRQHQEPADIVMVNNGRKAPCVIDARRAEGDWIIDGLIPAGALAAIADEDDGTAAQVLAQGYDVVDLPARPRPPRPAGADRNAVAGGACAGLPSAEAVLGASNRDGVRAVRHRRGRMTGRLLTTRERGRATWACRPRRCCAAGARRDPRRDQVGVERAAVPRVGDRGLARRLEDRASSTDRWRVRCGRRD